MKQYKKLSKVARISVAYAEDLYDSFFEKPVVQQYVADWYEENKDDFEINLFHCIGELVECYNKDSSSKFEDWLMDDDNEAFTILVNMHQFGYEVKEEMKYTVTMKNVSYNRHPQFLCTGNRETFWTCGGGFRKTKYTRKELEDADFGWVFDCPGGEVKEVDS